MYVYNTMKTKQELIDAFKSTDLDKRKYSNLIKLVADEAEKLKTHATQRELKNLHFEMLNGGIVDSCIYGQMTGHCYSQRAIELLNLCTIPYSDKLDYKVKPYNDKFTTERTRPFSAIEYFISMKYDNAEMNNEILIDYLKIN
jgi:hypothetical protein